MPSTHRLIRKMKKEKKEFGVGGWGLGKVTPLMFMSDTVGHPLDAPQSEFLDLY